MDAYRDQYAQLFKDGKVVLLAISTDADTTVPDQLGRPVPIAGDGEVRAEMFE